MTAVVNGTAGLGRIVYCAEVLPFTGPHFRTSGCRTGRCFGEEGNDEIVGLHGQEAAKFIQPKCFVNAAGRCGQSKSSLSCDRASSIVSTASMSVIEGFEVFLELERRFKLDGL